MAYLNTPDHYLFDTDYTALIDALTALDRDTAHPHPFRDRVAETLGEIGGVWPVTCLNDQIEQLRDQLPDHPVWARLDVFDAEIEELRRQLHKACDEAYQRNEV